MSSRREEATVRLHGGSWGWAAGQGQTGEGLTCQDRAEMLLFNKESQVFEEGCHATRVCASVKEQAGEKAECWGCCKNIQATAEEAGKQGSGQTRGRCKGEMGRAADWVSGSEPALNLSSQGQACFRVSLQNWLQFVFPIFYSHYLPSVFTFC